MFYYYEKDNKILASQRAGLPYPQREPIPGAPIYYLVKGDPVLGRGSFKVNHPGQLKAPHGLEVLDASRLPEFPLDATLSAALEAGQLTAVNTGRVGWESVLSAAPSAGKKRLNILAIGDVGSTLLTGLKLLGGDVLSSIGICDVSDQVTARWEFEMGQINLPWDYNAFPDVEVVPVEKLFDCDVFVFVASRGIPPVGSKVKDVRMAQFETNAAIVKQYAKMARAANFQGLWCAVSDPVDPLAKTAYLESNKDENGNWDGRGLRPEQVQGFGLGVMNARAAYYAKRDEKLSSFLTEGRSFGPHGKGLWIANSIDCYDEEISRELTQKTVTANLWMRELGFKPYVAPALSSGALSILRPRRGEWHCGSVWVDGVFMGVKNRYTPAGVETELLPRIPDQLFGHIQEAAEELKRVL